MTCYGSNVQKFSFISDWFRGCPVRSISLYALSIRLKTEHQLTRLSLVCGISGSWIPKLSLSTLRLFWLWGLYIALRAIVWRLCWPGVMPCSCLLSPRRSGSNGAPGGWGWRNFSLVKKAQFSILKPNKGLVCFWWFWGMFVSNMVYI